MMKRPAGMDFGTYKAMCGAKGTKPLDEMAFKALPVDGDDDGAEGADAPASDDDDDDGGEDGAPDADETGGGDNADPMNKGHVRVNDLSKALDAFEAVTSASEIGGGSRETFLKARLDQGTISKSERAELGRIWTGLEEPQPVDGRGRALNKALLDYLDPEDQNVVNAAPLLKSLLGGLQERLDTVTARNETTAEQHRQMLHAQGSLLKSACGALLEISEQNMRLGRINKALEQRLGLVERTPVAPRAVRTADKGKARPLAKSVSGGDNVSDTLSKSQVVTGFHTLIKAAGTSQDFATAQRLTEECQVFERGGALRPGTRAAVEGVIRG